MGVVYRSMVVSGSLYRWDRYHIITQLAIYKWYISGIYCQLGDYMVPTTYKGKQETPLNRYALHFLFEV